MGWIGFKWGDWPEPPPYIPPTGLPFREREFLAGLPGMVVDIRTVEKISRIPETDIEFGTAVLAGDSGDSYCRSASGEFDHPYATEELRFLGIAMRDMTSESGAINPWASEPTTGYRKSNWCVSIVCSGRVWTIARSAVHEGDPVVILPDGTLTTSDNPAWFIPGARWVTSAPAGMLAVVDLNRPHRDLGSG